MTPSRRDALILGASMIAVASAAALGRPKLRTLPNLPQIDLESVFPRQFAGWQEDVASKSFVRPPEFGGKAYGIYDQLLERAFNGTEPGQRIMLSVAFGGDQSTSFQLHRPETCYEAGGYEVDDLHAERLMLAGRNVPVMRLRAAKPFRPEPITYWTVLGNEVVGNRLRFRLKRLFAGLQAQQNLSGMLVRVSSIDENTERAYALQGRFAADLALALSMPDRDAVLGASSDT